MQNTAFFGSLDPHRRDLCAAVLALCAPDFEEKPAPAPEFLSALYQKLCAQMFPDGLPEIPTLTADEMAYLTALEAALVEAETHGGNVVAVINAVGPVNLTQAAA